MKGILKSKLLIVLLSVLIFINCFGKQENKASATKNTEESVGFLSNINSF